MKEVKKQISFWILAIIFAIFLSNNENNQFLKIVYNLLYIINFIIFFYYSIKD